ncbi:MAG: HD domain-containing protein [Ferruginibacter sp.]|nr:HD domain-containing protein [Bacteroidota bacterium]MCW5915867.1 HD domain-containing protein [Ferruginibacter sp.]
MDISCSNVETFLIEKIAAAANSLGMEAFLIGGFVRDKILNRPTKDMDIVCTGDGILLAESFAQSFSHKAQLVVFKNFGTAQVKLGFQQLPQPEQDAAFEVEFVGARKESYSQNSRKPQVSSGTVEDDQKRRDLTINAMAISLNPGNFGKLIDPFHGLSDLKDRVLRTPLEPSQTFSDDPLRIMRTIRFAAQLNFEIHPETLKAIAENASRIRIVSGERVADELNKILLCPKPSVGFNLLFNTGVLQEIFPQMVALAGAEYIDGMGHKDNFHHTLQVIDNVASQSDDLWLRWAAVLHDIAKPATKKFEEGHGWTFHGHEVLGGKMVPRIFAKLKLPLNEKMRFVQKLVEMHLRPISLTKENITDSAIRRLLFDAGEDLESLMILCRADITSKNKQKVKRYLQNFELVLLRCKEVEEKDHIRNWQPPISGEMIMETFGIPSGREVGVIKNAIREAILDGKIPNEYQDAHALMLKIAAGLGIFEAPPH